jgi:hypothetical protein
MKYILFLGRREAMGSTAYKTPSPSAEQGATAAESLRRVPKNRMYFILKRCRYATHE